MTRVLTCTNGNNNQVYHDSKNSCAGAKRLVQNGRFRWLDKSTLDSWGYTRCKWCSGESSTNIHTGEQLSTRLEKLDPDELGGSA